MTLSSEDLSVVVISYNTKDMTIECIRSLHAQPLHRARDLLILDNCSTDNSADAIGQAFPQLTLIRSKENLGFARANNLAAKKAVGHWLLLLNPDTVVMDCAIERLVDFAERHPEASIFGGRTVFSDHSLNPGSCWRRPTLWSVFCAASGLTSLFPNSDFFSRESYGSWKRDSVREVEIVSGCFFLIRRSLWEQLEGFDSQFFMYGEEADLCLRAKALGHKCLLCPEAIIIHYGGASETVRADKMVRLFKAKALLFDRHWAPHCRWFGVRCIDLWAVTRVLAFSLLKWFHPRWADGSKTWRGIWRHRAEWRTAQIRPPDMNTHADLKHVVHEDHRVAAK